MACRSVEEDECPKELLSMSGSEKESSTLAEDSPIRSMISLRRWALSLVDERRVPLSQTVTGSRRTLDISKENSIF